MAPPFRSEFAGPRTIGLDLEGVKAFFLGNFLSRARAQERRVAIPGSCRARQGLISAKGCAPCHNGVGWRLPVALGGGSGSAGAGAAAASRAYGRAAARRRPVPDCLPTSCAPSSACCARADARKSRSSTLCRLAFRSVHPGETRNSGPRRSTFRSRRGRAFRRVVLRRMLMAT